MWYCSKCGYGPHEDALHDACISCGWYKGYPVPPAAIKHLIVRIERIFTSSTTTGHSHQH
ncbi:hypothetical protein BJ508DRAFT_320609 [Ascobolus immersus RN42]|uniref:Uncharacterized protein n=1 Tax=Ascobolus immersus RN42 TaxID=1160509 RepID=A0A3N4IPC0_ASCIM|nr:hypothetical protein BJ508DRAFT_320609 [Ascobolus immersus RN42]